MNIFIKKESCGLIIETIFFGSRGWFWKMGKNKKNRKKNDNESSNLKVGRSIATLKQKKTSPKSSFTRTRHKFEELQNEDLPCRCEVKEYQKKID